MKVKRLFDLTVVIMAAAMVCAAVLMLSGTAYAAEHTHDGVTFQPWNSDNSLPTDRDEKYYLTKDVILSKFWEPPKGTINLCLNGHGIILKGNKTLFMLMIVMVMFILIYTTAETRRIIILPLRAAQGLRRTSAIRMIRGANQVSPVDILPV